MAKGYLIGSPTINNRSFTTDYKAQVETTIVPFKVQFFTAVKLSIIRKASDF